MKSILMLLMVMFSQNVFAYLSLDAVASVITRTDVVGRLHRIEGAEIKSIKIQKLDDVVEAHHDAAYLIEVNYSPELTPEEREEALGPAECEAKLSYIQFKACSRETLATCDKTKIISKNCVQ